MNIAGLKKAELRELISELQFENSSLRAETTILTAQLAEWLKEAVDKSEESI